MLVLMSSLPVDTLITVDFASLTISLSFVSISDNAERALGVYVLSPPYFEKLKQVVLAHEEPDGVEEEEIDFSDIIEESYAKKILPQTYEVGNLVITIYGDEDYEERGREALALCYVKVNFI